MAVALTMACFSRSPISPSSLRGGVEQRRLDRSRRHRVAAHAIARGLAGDRLGEADHTGLGGGVDRRALRAHAAGLARDVHDRAGAALLHGGKHRVRDREHAAQVDAQHEIPQALVGVDEVGEPVGAGVVDEHIDLAERLDSGGDTGAHRAGVGHVEGAGEPVELAGDRAGALQVEVPDRHARAFRGQPAGGGGSDTRRAAGDERGLALEPHRAKPILGRRATVAHRPGRHRRRLGRARLRPRREARSGRGADRDRLARARAGEGDRRACARRRPRRLVLCS